MQTLINVSLILLPKATLQVDVCVGTKHVIVLFSFEQASERGSLSLAPSLS
jgi:hypothetical protein